MSFITLLLLLNLYETLTIMGISVQDVSSRASLLLDNSRRDVRLTIDTLDFIDKYLKYLSIGSQIGLHL